jgi:CRP-like cAMP-binding protein
MTTSEHGAPANRLLATLPDRSRRNFLSSCDYVHLNFSEVLCEQGEKIRYVYFPLDSFVSLVTALDDGAKLEVGIVGDEGMLGSSVILGINISPQHALVQGAGSALRMTTVIFLRHFKRSTALRQVLHRYVYVLMRQLALNAACTHYHVVETRLARWLLMTRDRAHSDQFHITHEFLAYMLGVRRVGITEAATALHDRGLIEYRRGEIVILDRAALEKKSCRCYRQGQAMYEQTLGKRSRSVRRR